MSKCFDLQTKNLCNNYSILEIVGINYKIPMAEQHSWPHHVSQLLRTVFQDPCYQIGLEKIHQDETRSCLEQTCYQWHQFTTWEIPWTRTDWPYKTRKKIIIIVQSGQPWHGMKIPVKIMRYLTNFHVVLTGLFVKIYLQICSHNSM